MHCVPQPFQQQRADPTRLGAAARRPPPLRSGASARTVSDYSPWSNCGLSFDMVALITSECVRTSRPSRGRAGPAAGGRRSAGAGGGSGGAGRHGGRGGSAHEGNDRGARRQDPLCPVLVHSCTPDVQPRACSHAMSTRPLSAKQQLRSSSLRSCRWLLASDSCLPAT